MDNETFRSRVSRLMQKSRKALRLYTNIGRIHEDENSGGSEIQIREWRSVNADLLKQLTNAMENPSNRLLAAEIYAIKDRFCADYRGAEADLHRKQKWLVQSATSGDFINAAILSNELIVLKARQQASHAAHHELEDILTKSHVSLPAIELTKEQVILDEEATPNLSGTTPPPQSTPIQGMPVPPVQFAKVIQLRKRS